MMQLGEELKQQSSTQVPINGMQYGEELDKHNDQMSQYIKSQFMYTYTTTVIEVKIPALNRDMLENDEEYNLIVREITDELKKFGALRHFFINGSESPIEVFLPRPSDINMFQTIKDTAIGKAFAEYEEVTSAFACYNLLNTKSYMGQPVEINFFNKDEFLTKVLY
jgi:hypothetical protein